MGNTEHVLSPDALRSAISAAHITQTELARRVDMSRRWVATWARRGGAGVPPEHEARVRAALGLPPVEGGLDSYSETALIAEAMAVLAELGRRAADRENGPGASSRIRGKHSGTFGAPGGIGVGHAWPPDPPTPKDARDNEVRGEI